MQLLTSFKNSYLAPDTQSGRRLFSIDGLRGLLILHVMLHHFMLYFARGYYFGLIQNFVGNGYLAVRFFFAVSGFLLFQQMEKRARGDSKPVLYFYLRRFFRIYPLWFFTVCLYWLLLHIDFLVVRLNLTFMFGFFSYDPANTPIGQAWSLFTEEWFYLLFPLVFFVTQKLRGTLILLVLTSALSWFWLQNARGFGIPSTNYFIEFFPLAHLHFFILGILVYQLNQWPHWQEFLKLSHTRWILELTSLISVVGLLTNYAITYPAICIFLAFLALSNEKTILSKICSVKMLRVFGVCCYPLYLIHMLILIYLNEPVRNFIIQQNFFGTPAEIIGLVGFPVFAILCLGISLVLRTLIELPLIEWGNKIILKAQKAS